MINLDTTLFTVENNARTQINELGGVASGDTTFTVDSVANFSVGMICTLSDREYIQNSSVTERVRITGISGSDLTVTRNIDGLGAQTFLNNQWITGANNAEPIAQLQKITTNRLFIVPVVSGNNLTVNVSTTPYDPANPTVFTSPTQANPIPVWIGGQIRWITSALSVTANAGTNYLNMGSAELATIEVDLFPYLQWNTTTSTVNLLYARIPYARIMSDLVNSNTNEKGAVGIVNYNATNDVVNIGRFAATLSAGAGYTWTVPTFTNANLIQEPTLNFRQELLDWTPDFTQTGGMTFTGTSVTYAKYELRGRRCFIDVRFSGTTGGTADTQIEFTVPFTPSQTTVSMAGGTFDGGGGGAITRVESGRIIGAQKGTVTNWGLGASKFVNITGEFLI
jgi:hypothetical protein